MLLSPITFVGNNDLGCQAGLKPPSFGMTIGTSVSDPLVGVRHRTPSLTSGEVDYGLLTELTGFSLKLVWILGHGLLSREFEDPAITPHRFSTLEVISRNPGLQQTQLAAALAMTRPATTLAVDFWEERGCVERRKIAGDRRLSGVYTTSHGDQELERLRAKVRKADAALTTELSQDEIKSLRRLLRKIHL
jgi:DNA-binding MarR family transcriptional regulator